MTKPLRAIRLWILAALLLPSTVMAQNITNTTNGNLTATVAFGTLTPGNRVISFQDLQFRIRDKQNNQQYRVTATATFNIVPSAGPSGGQTMSAADVGVGIVNVDTSASKVITPRTDTISAGFNYDPSSVAVINGLTPYAGTPNQATLQDIINQPNIALLSGPQISNSESPNNNNNAILVTLRFGILPQFWTPASFSSTVTLTIGVF